MRRSLPLLCGAVAAGLSGIAATFAGAQVAAGESRVLVLPFVVSSGSGSEGLGRAVQQDLFADLTQGTTARIVAPSSVPGAIDADGAVRAAREAGASIVVFGQAQTSGKEVRLTGQVIDVATATPLGAIKATGPSDDLFHLEDALAGQVFVAMPRTLLKAQTLEGVQQQPPSPSASETVQSAPTEIVPPPVTSAAAAPPVVIENYPVSPSGYSYDYGSSPVYDYSACSVPAYTYASPGCDLLPPGGIYIGVGGYGCYDGYGYHGGGYQHYQYGHYGYNYHHNWDHHSDGGYHGNGAHGEHSEYRGGHEFVGAGNHPFAGPVNRFDHAGSTTLSPVRSEIRSGGFSRPNYLSPPSPHISSGGFRTGSAGAGPFHSSPGGEHGFSPSASSRGSQFNGSGVHSSGGGSSHSQGGSAGGAFHGGGGSHSGGGGGGHRGMGGHR